MNNYKNHKDDALAADWLRDNGLDAKTFTNSKLDVVRAQKTAHTLLTQHLPLLSKRQLHALNDFQHAASNKRQRSRITPAFCYCVMNISANINRQLFKKHRKLERQSGVISNS